MAIPHQWAEGYCNLSLSHKFALKNLGTSELVCKLNLLSMIILTIQKTHLAQMKQIDR